MESFTHQAEQYKLKAGIHVDREALMARVHEGSVVVLDVRPEDEYRAGHIPGALSVPLGRLKEVLSQLPKDQEIAAYCRGPYCVLSVEAVGILRRQGFNAVRLEEGVEDWRAMGFAVTAGPPGADAIARRSKGSTQ